jgi:hypothetical protein
MMLRIQIVTDDGATVIHESMYSPAYLAQHQFVGKFPADQSGQIRGYTVDINFVQAYLLPDPCNRIAPANHWEEGP